MAEKTKHEILIGADPEFFLRRNDGEFVSAHGLIPGDKAQPYEVENGAIQVDGVACEFNIHPSKTTEEFISNIQSVMGNLRARVPMDFNFAMTPIAVFKKEYFEGLPEDTKVLGCTPDFDAYTGMANPPPKGDGWARTASGHIHIGWTNDADPYSGEHMKLCRRLVKMLDEAIGVYQKAWDPDECRPYLYGKPGAFRPKPYGLEYRVLSNAWLRSEDIAKWVFETTLAVANRVINHDWRSTPTLPDNICEQVKNDLVSELPSPDDFMRAFHAN